MKDHGKRKIFLIGRALHSAHVWPKIRRCVDSCAKTNGWPVVRGLKEDRWEKLGLQDNWGIDMDI